MFLKKISMKFAFVKNECAGRRAVRSHHINHLPVPVSSVEVESSPSIEGVSRLVRFWMGFPLLFDSR
jgi:hypothetical protein